MYWAGKAVTCRSGRFPTQTSIGRPLAGEMEIWVGAAGFGVLGSVPFPLGARLAWVLLSDFRVIFVFGSFLGISQMKVNFKS